MVQSCPKMASRQFHEAITFTRVARHKSGTKLHPHVTASSNLRHDTYRLYQNDCFGRRDELL